MKDFFIAIVEDDPDDRDFITTALLENNKTLFINTFVSGMEFFEFLQSAIRLPDLVVTDIRMPLINGFDVIKRVKNDTHTKDIPIIVLSTSGNVNDKAQAAQLGALQYFTKPFSLNDYNNIAAEILKYEGWNPGQLQACP